MAVASFITTAAPFVVEFDRNADVLYVTSGWDGPVEGTGLPDGIELDFRLDTNTPCGVTIIGFTAYAWQDRLPELAAIVADHLGLSRERIASELSAALAG